MSLSSTTDNRKAQDAIERAIKSLPVGRVAVAGVLEGSGGSFPDGTPVAVAAATNEYGSRDGSIPERPAFRRAFDKNRKKYDKIAADVIVRAVKSGARLDRVFQTVAMEMRSDIVKEIKGGDFAPNAPSTLRRKGQGKQPLTDTGLTAARVAFEVRDEGGAA